MPFAWTGRKPGCGPASVRMVVTISAMTRDGVLDPDMIGSFQGLSVDRGKSRNEATCARSLRCPGVEWAMYEPAMHGGGGGDGRASGVRAATDRRPVTSLSQLAPRRRW